MRYFSLGRMLQINAASKEDYSCYIVKEQKPFPHHFAYFLTPMIHGRTFILENTRIFYMSPHIWRQILKILSLSCQVSKSVSWLYFRYHYSFFCAQIYQSLMASHEPPFIHMYIFKLMFIFINPILFISIFCELESEMTSLSALSRKYNLYFHLHLYLYQYSNLLAP